MAEEVTKSVINHAKDVRPDDLQAYYIISYLPMVVDCLASIADSLEKIASEKEDK
ncbi:hypothetical protein [Butyrivibrio sp. INlla21]|uniref:hypothetical protein n=1 Tax=Butyrivibrio sp. INlla21 TaxID=1520811 RepID=UPI0015A6BC88|nr:hypothetical protein [Butyrivibrio sp. INlla21]